MTIRFTPIGDKSIEANKKMAKANKGKITFEKLKLDVKNQQLFQIELDRDKETNHVVYPLIVRMVDPNNLGNETTRNRERN